MSATVEVLPVSPTLPVTKKERSKKSIYLEKVIQERNELLSQNSKLWKVIHKQRLIIKELQNCILKEDSSSTSSTITSDNENDLIEKPHAKKINKKVSSSTLVATKDVAPIYSMPFLKTDTKQNFNEIKKSIDYGTKSPSTKVPYVNSSKPLNYNDIINPPEMDIILPTQNNPFNLNKDDYAVQSKKNKTTSKSIPQDLKNKITSDKEKKSLDGQSEVEDNDILTTSLLMISNSQNHTKDESDSAEAEPGVQSITTEDKDFNFSFGLNKSDQPLIKDENSPIDSSSKENILKGDNIDEDKNKINNNKTEKSDKLSYELKSLDNIGVSVSTVSTKTNSKGKEIFVFRIQVIQSQQKSESTTSQNPALNNSGVWSTEKNYSQLSKLNNQLKEDENYSKVMGLKLPSKSCWAATDSSKLDQSKIMLQEFLQIAIDSNKTIPNPVSEFLTKGKIWEEKKIEISSSKEGYLMKSDQSSVTGTKYYFKIINDVMEYYTDKNGNLVGEIQLAHAQVKQIPLDKNSESSNRDFPFIFEVMEPNKETQTMTSHILGTARTGERREWIKAAQKPFVSNLENFGTMKIKDEGSNQLESSQVPQKVEPNLDTKKNDNELSKEKKDSGIANKTKAADSTVSKANDKEKAIKRTLLWGKRILDFGKSKHLQLPVFGVPLGESVMASKKSESCPLPSIVYRCIEYLDAKEAHLEEGIYRLSGSSATITLLKSKFETEGDYNILKSGIYYDVNAVAGVLKLYLREIPTSVLTEELHDTFDKLSEIPDRRGRIKKAGQLVLSLPLENYTLLSILIGHLIRIVEQSAVNKMPLKNIGIVFSPTLGIPAVLFCLIMADHKYIFSVDENGNPAPQELPEGEDDAKLGPLDCKLEISTTPVPMKPGDKAIPTSSLGNLIPIKKG